METIFIAGPRAIKKLDEKILLRLKNLKDKNHTIYVGDANGVDKLIQNFYSNLEYENVEVFSSNGKVRNNIGQWKVNNIEVDKSIKGFDFYAEKDRAMAKRAKYGFMIWNCKSKGTLNNMINLRREDKNILLYLTPIKEFYLIDSDEKLLETVARCSEETQEIYKELINKNQFNSKQITISI